jgi:hypothetical protein
MNIQIPKWLKWGQSEKSLSPLNQKKVRQRTDQLLKQQEARKEKQEEITPQPPIQ